MDNLQTPYPIEKFLKKAIIISQECSMDLSLIMIPNNIIQYIDKVIISKGMKLDRIEKMAEEIILDNLDKSIYFLVIMKGAVKYASYLDKKLNDILKCSQKDYSNFVYFLEYISISSYHNIKSTGVIHIQVDEKVFNKLRGKHVIIVEDLLDSGKTISSLINLIRKDYNPASMKTAFLFQKMNIEHLEYDLVADYLGFLIPNEFIIGFGTDYNQYFRSLEHLCILNQKGYDTYSL